MDNLYAEPCCQQVWQELKTAWTQHGNAAAFWDTYQGLLERTCLHMPDAGNCANHLARMAQRLGAVPDAMLV